jgi:hypothetical protein
MIRNLSSRAFLISESKKNFLPHPDSVESSSFSLTSSSPLGIGDCESSSSPLGLACDMSCSICVSDVLCRFAGCVSSAIVVVVVGIFIQ